MTCWRKQTEKMLVRVAKLTGNKLPFIAPLARTHHNVGPAAKTAREDAADLRELMVSGDVPISNEFIENQIAQDKVREITEEKVVDPAGKLPFARETALGQKVGGTDDVGVGVDKSKPFINMLGIPMNPPVASSSQGQSQLVRTGFVPPTGASGMPKQLKFNIKPIKRKEGLKPKVRLVVKNAPIVLVILGAILLIGGFLAAIIEYFEDETSDTLFWINIVLMLIGIAIIVGAGFVRFKSGTL